MLDNEIKTKIKKSRQLEMIIEIKFNNLYIFGLLIFLNYVKLYKIYNIYIYVEISPW